MDALYECLACGITVTEDESESVCVFPGTYYDQPEYDTLCKPCYDRATEWADKDEALIRESEEAYEEWEQGAREDEENYLAQ